MGSKNQCYTDTGAGVRFGKYFWDTADNTRNPTRVSESDTDAGCLTRQKNLDTGVHVTRGSHIEMTGPKRGIALVSEVMFEFDMRIKNGEKEEDDLQLIDGLTELYEMEML